MKLFSSKFNTVGIPTLFIGSTGLGIKLYISKDGYSLERAEGWEPSSFDIPVDPFPIEQDLVLPPESFVPKVLDLPVSAPQDIEQQPLVSVNTEKKPTNNSPAPVLPPASAPKAAPVIHKFSDELKSKGYTVVSDETKDDVVLNILLQRLFPNKTKGFTYGDNQIFKGSKRIVFKTKKIKAKINRFDRELVILDKPDKQFIPVHKNACIEALNAEFKFNESDAKQKKQVNDELARLREWCTEPKIKDVLGRHKFQLLTEARTNATDEDWKEVIAGGWFKKEKGIKYWEKQAFILPREINEFLGKDKLNGISSKSQVTQKHIDKFKEKCKAVLEKPFTRSTFYIPTAFWKETKPKPGVNIDPFQEAALFCSKPMKVEDYISKAMQGVPKKAFVTTDVVDYCYVKQSINQYKKFQTNQPIEGKSFWCAVKLLYGQNKTSTSSRGK
ncbi:hypothetical protein [Candidatus Mycoplasma haematohominis]|uniref:hypothetical protein n=1 Tax=Candidatus Mycoplasma haematohominis TaxID=1494318 RepID=UPI001C0A6B2D|nr:hypothetical protein [Candidatus Mycoplasma haemohominis]